MTPEKSREYLDRVLDGADTSQDEQLFVVYGRTYSTRLWCILGRSQGYGIGAARPLESNSALEPMSHVALSSFSGPREFRLRPTDCPAISEEATGDRFVEVQSYNNSAEFPEDNP